MSLYNKTKWDRFVQVNYDNIKQLQKFSNMNSADDILRIAKLTKNQIYELRKIFSVVYYDINKLKIATAARIQMYDPSKNIKIPMPLSIYESTYNNLTNNIPLQKSFANEFYEFDWGEQSRNGTISLTSCDSTIPSSRTIAQDKYLLNLSTTINYFGETFDLFGRFIYFKNKCPLRILKPETKNYSGRYSFRYYLTIMILGDDYKFNFKDEVFPDGTLGQEIIYYLLEIYAYDRYHFLFNAYSKLTAIDPNITLEDFYGASNIDEVYPAMDGVYYYDHSIAKSINIRGTEILIFTPELLLNISEVFYITDESLSPGHNPSNTGQGNVQVNDKIKLVKTENKQQFIQYLSTFISKYNKLSNKAILYDNDEFNKLNEILVANCSKV
jgi:hypothetical protein